MSDVRLREDYREGVDGNDSKQPDSTLSNSTANNHELSCSICMNFFTKASVLNCGHSFCSSCIFSWLEERNKCPSCRAVVRSVTKNIALQNVVDKHEQSATSSVSTGGGSRTNSVIEADETADESDVDGPSSVQSMLARASRKCRFSDDPEVVIIDDEINNFGSLRLAPSASAQPLRSALVSSQPPRAPDSESEVSDSDDESTPAYFQRHSSGRRSENLHLDRHGRVPSSRGGSQSPDQNDNGASVFQRFSPFRRSIGVIRHSRGRRELPPLPPPMDVAPAAPADNPSSSSNNTTVRRRKSIWRRLLPFKIKRRTVYPVNQPADPTGDNPIPVECPIPVGSVCAYSGTGRHFKKICRGEEITVVVFGKRGVGKTTFLDNAALSVDFCTKGSPRMVRSSERVEWSGVSIQTTPLAHMMTMTISSNRKTYVIDIIDAECELNAEVGPSPVASFEKSADAAILLYSCLDTASLLPVMSIRRNMSKRTVPVTCALVGNNYADRPRLVKEEMARKLAKTMSISHYETNLSVPGPRVMEVLLELCRSVLSKRGEDVSFL